MEFRLWAPQARSATVVVEDGAELPMDRQADGTWVAVLQNGAAGVRYRFRLDGDHAYPDPYSRFQPEGVHGPSEVVDPNAFRWRHEAPKVDAGRLAIYELHCGTFTAEGTFDAAIERLPELATVGVTAVEVMPVAEFSGRWNWGYDGVDWFAPSRNYGGPEAFRRFVDAAHRHGLSVLLDVVYNHFGPEGNYLRAYSPDYFTEAHQTAWGAAINYGGCAWARRLAIDNAVYWVREFHVDGFRLDATFAIYDDSPRHLLAELSDAVRAEQPNTVLIAETHENDPKYFTPTTEGGYGFDACWADDFHHVMRRMLAGDHEAYFANYRGTVEELVRAINQGFLYEGQANSAGERRGKPAREAEPRRFVYCIQNHDQVGNRALGDRLSAGIGLDAYRAASLVLLSLPMTPMLWMGQEFAASTPFQYFTDHEPELGRNVTEGRRKEFRHFAAFSAPGAAERIPDPQAEGT
ncbi:MAG TPA: malto-oligosyltrehalose trehalohydrolase, partial [Chloroflexota bacterium]|nr:malto-oligosyltrehalose trehalohydrolase [Chloroflexota bacterium]